MRIVIGDVHGELQKMRDLLSLVKNSEEYIFIGDYIDKGDHSFEVIDFLVEFSRNNKCIFLTGNHEFVWLRYLFEHEYFRKDFLIKHGSITFASSYLKRTINPGEFEQILDMPKELIEMIPVYHLNFLLNLLPWYIPEGTNYLCVHAGVDPDLEIGGLNNHPLERYLFVRKKFIYSNTNFFNKKVIFGHTACRFPYIDSYKIGIDTGATYKNYGILTAYDIDSDTFIQHNGVIIQKEDLIRKNKLTNPFDEIFNLNRT